MTRGQHLLLLVVVAVQWQLSRGDDILAQLQAGTSCSQCSYHFCTSLPAVDYVSRTDYYLDNADCVFKIAPAAHTVDMQMTVQTSLVPTANVDGSSNTDVVYVYWCLKGKQCTAINNDLRLENWIMSGVNRRTFSVSDLSALDAVYVRLKSDSALNSDCYTADACLGYRESPRTYAGVRVAYVMRCDSGYYQTSSRCEPCEVGKFAASVGTVGSCQPCHQGLYQAQIASTSCAQCDAGKYTPASSTGFSACLSCDVGKFAEALQRAECTCCGAGKYGAVAGASSEPVGCLQCLPGSFSAGTCSLSCQPCAPGSYQDEFGKSVCKVCPPGSYSKLSGGNGVGSCLSCQLGLFSDARGTDCYSCAAGTFLNGPGSVCRSCEPGHYAGAPKLTTCTTCAPGTFAGVAGSVGCDACLEGTYAAEAGSSVCTECQPGTYSWAESATCDGCPAGTFSNVSGLQHPDDCAICPAGTFSVQGAANCSSCPVGTHAARSGVPRCLPCGRGRYANESGTSCELCPAGTYYDQSNTANDRCTSCPRGKYSAALGATSSTFCLDCKPGNRYSPGDGATACLQCDTDVPVENNDHVSCRSTRCPGGSVPWYMFLPAADDPLFLSFNCRKCQPGTYEDMDDEGICKVCPSGKYEELEGQMECSDCPYRGQLSKHPFNELKDCFCPDGKYALVDANRDYVCADCQPCEQGRYWSRPCTNDHDRGDALDCSVTCGGGRYIKTPCTCETNIECAVCPPCPKGTRVRAWCNGVNRNECEPCEAGTFTFSEQQGLCSLCPAGSFSAAGAASCTPCPAGMSSIDGAATCSACPIGTYAPAPGQYCIPHYHQIHTNMI